MVFDHVFVVDYDQSSDISEYSTKYCLQSQLGIKIQGWQISVGRAVPCLQLGHANSGNFQRQTKPPFSISHHCSESGATEEEGPWSGVALNPLHLLRKFLWHDRPVRVEGADILLGEDSFPRQGSQLIHWNL